MNSYSDSALIIKCKARDKDAFRVLVERYKKQAFAFAFSYLKNADDALNVSQDAFVRAWNAIDRFMEGKSFKPWLMSIVKNLSLNRIAKTKRLRETSLDQAMEESAFDIPDRGSSPLEKLEQKETNEFVWKAVMCLKDDFREIIVLKHFQDLSYREISEALEIPEGTVMSRLYYARMELKKNLEAVSLGS